MEIVTRRLLSNLLLSLHLLLGNLTGKDWRVDSLFVKWKPFFEKWRWMDAHYTVSWKPFLLKDGDG